MLELRGLGLALEIGEEQPSIRRSLSMQCRTLSVE
jgi:hypothetical protein